MVRFSVILPAYNVSKYIESCLNSFVRQSFTNYEIIIVDEGSNDNLWNIVSLESARKFDFKASLEWTHHLDFKDWQKENLPENLVFKRSKILRNAC